LVKKILHTKNKIYLFIALLLISISCGGKKYNILNAPKATDILADYENIFSKSEYNSLLKQMKNISQKHGVEIYFFTIYSLKGLNKSKNGINNNIGDRSYEIFSLPNDNGYNDKNPVIIYVFSHHDKFNGFYHSFKFAEIIDFNKYNNATDPIISKYFSKHKYYQAFKEIFEVLDNELRANKI